MSFSQARSAYSEGRDARTGGWPNDRQARLVQPGMLPMYHFQIRRGGEGEIAKREQHILIIKHITHNIFLFFFWFFN